MKKSLKLILVALTLGIVISLGTYFYQREGAYAGVCVIGIKSPCNGDAFNDRGFPARYADPDNNISYPALAADVVLWSAVIFAILRFSRSMQNK